MSNPISVDDNFFLNLYRNTSTSLLHTPIGKSPYTMYSVSYYSPDGTYRGSKGSKKGVCRYGRKKGRCMSKKSMESKRRAAVKRIQRSFRKRKSGR